jgi:gas vesicle protein
MDYNQFEQLGDKLREVGHQRRELAEQVFSEVRVGEKKVSKDLFEQLSRVSDQAINIISQQKQILDQEVNKTL